MDTDNQLLENYAGKGSESAFRKLVERHINLVYSAALRETKGDVSLAEDITQAVFAELARRATQLVQRPRWRRVPSRRSAPGARPRSPWRKCWASRKHSSSPQAPW